MHLEVLQVSVLHAFEAYLSGVVVASCALADLTLVGKKVVLDFELSLYLYFSFDRVLRCAFQ